MRRWLFLAPFALLGAEAIGCGSNIRVSDEEAVPLAQRLASPDPNTAAVFRASSLRREGSAFASAHDAAVMTRLPLTLSEPWRLWPTRRDEEAVLLEPLGANAADGHDTRGVVTYENAYDGVDLLFAANSQRLEQFYLLRQPDARHVFRWNVALPPRWHARAAGNGWWVNDGTGAFALHARAPFALDARGSRIPARLDWSEEHRELSIELSRASTDAYPVLLDPSFEVEAWEEIARPSGNYSPALTFDQTRGEALLFGGYTNTGPRDDTWTWDGGWTRRTPNNRPSLRASSGITYDPIRKRAILFGGSTSSGTLLSDTWVWDGVDWALQSPQHRPPPLTGARLVFDSVRGKVVLFGGSLSTGYSSATWTWDGTDWKEEAIAGLPMQIAFGAFDASRGFTVAFGVANSFARETWILGGSGWTKVSAASSPFYGADMNLVYDANRAAVLAIGTDSTYSRTDTWMFNGTTWTLLPPSSSLPLVDAKYVFDSKRSQLLGISGYFRTGGGSSTDLWLGDANGGWKRDPGTSVPPARNFIGMPGGPLGTAMTFGGDGTTPRSDTWVLDGNRWEEKLPATHPPARRTGALAFDTKRQVDVLFGGTDGAQVPMNDTWEWDGTNWTLKQPAVKPPAASTPHMAYDSVRDRTLLLVNGSSTIDLWQWNGSTWSLTNPTSSPPARASAAFVFDRTRGNAVLFGGLGNNGPLADTWLWNGTDWVNATQGTRPSPRSGTTATWDAKRGRVVLFGGVAAGNTHLNDVWSWDGSLWSPLVDENLEVLPEGRTNMGMTTLEPSGSIVVQGGQNAVGSLTDQWVFHTRGGACSSGSQCGSGHCVDGVCCETASCGTCETCAGIDAGKCSKVVNAEDPDTCSTKSGRSCDASGVCQNGIGATCKEDADCAAKHCVSGFCCNSACNLPCEACAASEKLTQNDNGRCGPAKIGSNPGGRCGDTATCNAQGTCETRTLASCRGSNELDVGGGVLQNCAPYQCRSGKAGEAAKCLRACQSAADCAFPATCNPDGRCEERTLTADDSGCSVGAPGRSRANGVREGEGVFGRRTPELLFGAVVAAFLRARRRRNRTNA